MTAPKSRKRFSKRLRPHVFAGEVVAAEDDGVLVEDGDLAVIAEIGRAAQRGERQERHEPMHLAARLPDRVDKTARWKKGSPPRRAIVGP